MCPECFLCNEKHLVEHKSTVEPKQWIEERVREMWEKVLACFGHFREAVEAMNASLPFKKEHGEKKPSTRCAPELWHNFKI
jgi:hypothetical protein